MRLFIARVNALMFFSKELDDMELMEFEERIHYLEANFVRPAPLWIPSTGNLRFRRYSRDLRRLIRRFLDERRNTNTPISDICLMSFNWNGQV